MLVPEMFSDQGMLSCHPCYFANYLFPYILISINMHFAEVVETSCCSIFVNFLTEMFLEKTKQHIFSYMTTLEQRTTKKSDINTMTTVMQSALISTFEGIVQIPC